MALVPILFRWSGGGKQVHLCTIYHGWESNKIQMTCGHTSPDFTVMVKLPEGRHEYKYIVDGQWKHDPNEETFPNCFGTLNNVVRVTTTTVQVVCHGTIYPAASFNPETDADALRKAMKGIGTDEKTIIDILVHRSNAQRQEIKKKFKAKYGKDLAKELESELTGNMEDLVLALLEPANLYDVKCLRKAIKGVGTNERCLIEILCSRNNAEIQWIKQAYKSEYHRDLEKDIVGDTSKHFQRLLVSLCQGAREESTQVDVAKAQREAQELFRAGEKKLGTDESIFNKIIAVRSYPQLWATFDAYVKIAQRDITDSIRREMSGDLRDGMLAVVQCIRNRQVFFADQLHDSMKGAGTKDNALIRIVVSRSEVDLVEIKKAFLERHKKTLYKMIEGDTSGDYRKLLLAIVGPN